MTRPFVLRFYLVQFNRHCKGQRSLVDLLVQWHNQRLFFFSTLANNFYFSTLFLLSKRALYEYRVVIELGKITTETDPKNSIESEPKYPKSNILISE